ncbi:MAG: Gfo/Idh/MocA family oxidoreductase [Pseudomonadota bacterium]
MTPIALVGIGKIATDQHVPALAASPDFTLAATVSLEGTVAGIPAYTTLAEMLAAQPEVRALSFCVPPIPRYRLAAEALAAGRHVMLEKPPGASVAECRTLEAMARAQGTALYASWHSREAAGVEAARAWLAGRRITRLHLTWQEDVRRWHPGQAWIFQPGGLGVFDPTINAFSILTEIVPAPFHVTGATLMVPENAQAPIAATMAFHLDGAEMTADLDFLKEGEQIWRIEVKTDAGTLTLADGGARATVDGRDIGGGAAGDNATLAGEYPRLYANFAGLVAARAVDMDLAPMVHVADAYLLGQRVTVAAFHE